MCRPHEAPPQIRCSSCRQTVAELKVKRPRYKPIRRMGHCARMERVQESSGVISEVLICSIGEDLMMKLEEETRGTILWKQIVDRDPWCNLSNYLECSDEEQRESLSEVMS